MPAYRGLSGEFCIKKLTLQGHFKHLAPNGRLYLGPEQCSSLMLFPHHVQLQAAAADGGSFELTHSCQLCRLCLEILQGLELGHLPNDVGAKTLANVARHHGQYSVVPWGDRDPLNERNDSIELHIASYRIEDIIDDIMFRMGSWLAPKTAKHQPSSRSLNALDEPKYCV